MGMIEWLLDTSNYMPHGHCYLWQAPVLWLQVGSDALIAASYFTIPAILYYFVRSRRNELPFVGIPLLFAAFILLCGITHLLGIWTVWNPDYRLDGLVKLATGLVSASTAVALLKVAPLAMALQTPAQLQRQVDERTTALETANQRLQREIESRERTEAQLRSSEERFRLATRALRGYVYEYLPAAGLITRTDGFSSMFGIAPKEVSGKLEWWRGRVHPEDRGAVEKLARSLVDGIEAEGSAEYRVRSGSGQYVWVWDHAIAVRGPDGKIERIVGNVLDVSARRQAEEERRVSLESERHARGEAERANQMKQNFLATLSHELRTPLSTMTTWAQVLRRKPGDAEQVVRGAMVIEQAAQAQAQLIADLLDMSRIDSGKLRLEVQPVDLIQVVDAAVSTVQPAADARDIRVNRIVEPVDGTVRGDPARLQQILWNLLANAIKFTPKGGRVQVVVASVNSHVELSVTDTGQGIDPEFLPYVFERFRQEEGSTVRRHGGLGLGLAIVRQLVELHGGRVTASSPGPGRGATFLVELPLSPLHSMPNAGQAHPLSGDSPLEEDFPSVDGLRVLLVDDQPEALEGLTRLLEEFGVQVRVADSVVNAQAEMRRDTPDILISDIGMPAQDGYALIRTLRAEGFSLPCVALTALARAEDRTRALVAGFDAHLSKPVNTSELLATLATLIRGKRS